MIDPDDTVEADSPRSRNIEKAIEKFVIDGSDSAHIAQLNEWFLIAECTEGEDSVLHFGNSTNRIHILFGMLMAGDLHVRHLISEFGTDDLREEIVQVTRLLEYLNHELAARESQDRSG